MFQHILVATDGSAQAERAVALAADLSVRFGGALCILHVLPRKRLPEALRRFAEVEHLSTERPRRQMTGGVATMAERVGLPMPSENDVEEAAVYETIGRGILTSAEAIVKRRDAVAKSDMRSGDPASAILAMAEEIGADAIVLGRRGLGEIEGLLLGSVSHKVMQLADCTCISVK